MFLNNFKVKICEEINAELLLIAILLNYDYVRKHNVSIPKLVKTCILTKKIKLKKQRKYLAHCDMQLIFGNYFSTAPVINHHVH